MIKSISFKKMEQRNMMYTGPILETKHFHINSEPCVIPYGGITSFQQPNNNNNYTILPPSGIQTSFNPQFNGLDHHHHSANNAFMTTNFPRFFPGVINHGIQDQLSISSIHGSFENGQFIDVFKRKNGEGFAGNIQYFYPTSGSSSSIAIMNGQSLVMEPAVHRSMRNMGSGSIGVNPMLANNSSHMVPCNFGGQPFQAVHNPWLDQQYCGNGSDGGGFSWNYGPNLSHLQGPLNGGGLDSADVGLHGYQVTTINRISGNLVHHPPPPPPPPPPPMPPVQGPNIDFHSQGNFRVFRPHRREFMVDATASHRVFPHFRVLPEEEVAIFDYSEYHEAGHLVDYHRDMRLDIDHMSYEELLALGEQIGSVDSGLSNDFILQNLKTRKFASSKSSFEPGDASSADQELNSCVICQTNYDDQEQIGTLDCGHEYHVECVKYWLIMKNTCPICKSTAVVAKAKES